VPTLRALKGPPPRIEAGIPIPKRLANGDVRSRTTKFLLALDVGESFLVALEDRNNTRSRMAWARRRTGHTYVGRTTAQGFRVWRTK
jgi:hypothetical protein